MAPPHLLADRFETTDGSRPKSGGLEAAHAKTHPIVAFATLTGGGDAFVGTNLAADLAGAQKAAAACLRFERGCDKGWQARVVGDVVRMLTTNPRLAGRAGVMKPVTVTVVPAGTLLCDVGFPRAINERCAGVFWDHPRWSEARIGLRAEHLEKDPALVVHEYAHALHHLAFTMAERKAMDDVLLPVWGHRSAVDEVFAIYSEREFVPAFSTADKQAPGVYGATRRQWSDDHLFTRFVRKLYFPGRPLAGEQAPKAASWKKFLG
jgi:hypothetical protein